MNNTQQYLVLLIKNESTFLLEQIDILINFLHRKTPSIQVVFFFPAPKPIGRRSRKPGLDRKPRQAYSAKQLERLESEFKVGSNV